MKADGDRRPLVATVGDNPLPTLLSVAALKPPVVQLVASDRSMQVANRLCTLLQKRGMVVDCRAPITVPPYDYEGCRTVLARGINLAQAWDLDYSSGSKVMSAAAFDSWSEVPHAGRAYYTAEFRVGPTIEYFLIDSETSVCRLIDEPSLTLAELATLHGTRRLPRGPFAFDADEGRTAQILAEMIKGLTNQPCDVLGLSPQGNVPLVACVRGTRLYIVGIRDRRKNGNGWTRCTDTPSLKHVLFEAQLIAQAWGGGHARAAAATRLPSNACVVENVRNDVGLSFRPMVPGGGHERRDEAFNVNELEESPGVLDAWLRS